MVLQLRQLFYDRFSSLNLGDYAAQGRRFCLKFRHRIHTATLTIRFI